MTKLKKGQKEEIIKLCKPYRPNDPGYNNRSDIALKYNVSSGYVNNICNNVKPANKKNRGNTEGPIRYRKYGEKSLNLPPIAAFDMETDGLGGDLIQGEILTEDGIQFLFDSVEQAFEFMREHPGYRYLAHNASGYEFAYMYPALRDFYYTNNNIDVRTTIQGESRIVQIQIYKNGKPWIDLRDTLCLFNTSLAKVASGFCPDMPKLEGEIDFEHGERFDPTNERHMQYLHRDCEIVLQAYKRLAETLRSKFGSPIKVTAGSTSFAAFLTTVDRKKAYYGLSRKTEEFCRQAYYGAAVEPGHKIGDWGNVAGVDANGAYAYQMGENYYPVGSGCWTNEYVSDKLGVYSVQVTVPTTVFERYGINVIPSRSKYGLCWPSGRFSTVITSVEIEWIRKNIPEITIDVEYGVFWWHKEKIFANYIHKLEELELNEPDNKATYKIQRNAGYGKLGAKEEHVELIYQRGYAPDDLMPVYNKETGIPIDNLYTKQEISKAPYMMVHWALFVTAYERMFLFDKIIECYKRGAKNVYADTDSVKADRDIILGMVSDGTFEIGKKYGTWKLEEIADKFIVLGPKAVYSQTEGQASIRCKGIPTRRVEYDHFRAALENRRDDIRFDSVTSVMNIIKNNQSVKPIKRKRKITDIKNSYAWEINEDGYIYPKGYLAEKAKENSTSIQCE